MPYSIAQLSIILLLNLIYVATLYTVLMGSITKLHVTSIEKVVKSWPRFIPKSRPLSLRPRPLNNDCTLNIVAVTFIVQCRKRCGSNFNSHYLMHHTTTCGYCGTAEYAYAFHHDTAGLPFGSHAKIVSQLEPIALN